MLLGVNKYKEQITQDYTFSGLFRLRLLRTVMFYTCVCSQGGRCTPLWADTPLPGRPPWANNPRQTPLVRHPSRQTPLQADTRPQADTPT